MKENILIIGSGNLGSLLLKIWYKKKNIFILDSNKNTVRRLKSKFPDCSFYFDSKSIDFLKINLVVLCIKPQNSMEVIKSLKGRLNDKQLIISLVAGLEILNIRKYFLKNEIIRVMPNIFIGSLSSSTALFCDRSVKINSKLKIENLFKNTGKSIWLEKESDLNFFTATFGGGPAYLFYFMNILTKIAKENGISKKDCEQLVRSLIDGTSQYFFDNKESLEVSINKVTSRGGTTQEAIKSFEKNNVFYNVLNEGINKAVKKSKILSNELSKLNQ